MTHLTLVLAPQVEEPCLMGCIFLAGPIRNASATFFSGQDKKLQLQTGFSNSVFPRTMGHRTGCVKHVDLGSRDPSYSLLKQPDLLFGSPWFISFLLQPQWTKWFKPSQVVSLSPSVDSPSPGPQHWGMELVSPVLSGARLGGWGFQQLLLVTACPQICKNSAGLELLFVLQRQMV